MKRVIKLFLFALIVTAYSGCAIDIDYEKNIFPPRKVPSFIPDGEFEYEPFAHLAPLKSELDFAENLNTEGDFQFYPSSKESVINDYIETYGFVSPVVPEEYEVGAAYFSEEYNTIYIAYNHIPNGVHLSAYELYRIEKHAIAYFISDSNRSEDRNYLRAVLIYPDDGSRCSYVQVGEEEWDRVSGVGGCANYGGQHSTISLNSLSNIQDFLIAPAGLSEPKRDVFAHEWGHIATFYHMVKKGDESYEDYLRIRLGDHFDTIYPEGLPGAYSSHPSVYYIQPEEILADDYVELFYYREQKFEGDYEYYELIYNDIRNSLRANPSHPNHAIFEEVRYIAPFNPETGDYDRGELFEELFRYYTSSFFVPIRETITPIVVTPTDSSTSIIEYFASAAHLGDENKIRQINAVNNIRLIAVEEVTRHGQTYYRVVLSALSIIQSSSHDKKDVAYHMGYVYKHDYNPLFSQTVYKISNFSDSGSWSPMNQNQATTVLVNGSNSGELGLFAIPFYDFAYATGQEDGVHILMYDYLHEVIENQIFKIHTGSLEPTS